jgi:hypothetical protein
MQILVRQARAMLVACACIVASDSAFAVYVSGSGFGQALIYPYYTVRSTDGNAFNTYIAIANGELTSKAVRVRFREGRNGREVAGFNLFLGAKRMWAAALAPTASGARLLTRDPSCTLPAFTPQAGGATFLDLTSVNFTGSLADGMGTSEDRVREGYVEVLEMATLGGANLDTPAACADLNRGVLPATGAPGGYLHGSLTLINVANGMDFTTPAEALANLAAAAYYRPPSDPYPDFNASEIGRVASFLLNDKFYRIPMPTGLAAVEAALVRSGTINEVVVDAVTQSTTDWIVTMPTRRFHASGIPSAWFGRATLSGPIVARGTYVSRNGSALVFGESCFPCTPSSQSLHVEAPWAVSVFGVGRSNASQATSAAGTTPTFGSSNGWLIGFQNAGDGGTLEMDFANGFNSVPYAVVDATSTRLADGATANERLRLLGLPMVGFMARTLRNGTLTCGGASCQGNYGGSLPHRYKREVQPTTE